MKTVPMTQNEFTNAAKLNTTLEAFGLSRPDLAFTEAMTSAVTTAWGVKWSEDYIARDLMQNFYDANRDQTDQIRVHTRDRDVWVTAPANFNLKRLFFLGSEKGGDDIGQYGEGFKAAATCLLRDQGVKPIILSGDQVLTLNVSETTVEETDLQPLEYTFFQTKKSFEGTTLILPHCPPAMVKAMGQGLTHFLYPTNPLIGAQLWSRNGSYAIHRSNTDCGYVFYRRLKRAVIPGIALVLVINKEFDVIERKISKDRDRNAFGDELLKHFYNKFATYGLKHDEAAQAMVFKSAKHLWSSGHPLLREIADTHSSSHPFSTSIQKELFDNHYFAGLDRWDRQHTDANKLVDVMSLERKWLSEGKKCLPHYFNRLGVSTALDEIKRIHEAARAEAMKNNQRDPSACELRSIACMSNIMKRISPALHKAFHAEQASIHYCVAETDVVLGQLKESRKYRERSVFLSAQVFVADMPSAVAVFLHEHAHIHGSDGSRGFTDELTVLIENVLRLPNAVRNQMTQEWSQHVDMVLQERNIQGQADHLNPRAWIAKLGADELQALLASAPLELIASLKKANDGASADNT